MFEGIKKAGKACISFMRDAGAEAAGKKWVEDTMKKMSEDPRDEVFGAIQEANLGPGSNSALWRRIEQAVRERRDNSLIMNLAKTPPAARKNRYTEYSRMTDEEFWTTMEVIKHDPFLQPVLWVADRAVREGRKVKAWLEQYPDFAQGAKGVVDTINRQAKADLPRLKKKTAEVKQLARRDKNLQRRAGATTPPPGFWTEIWRTLKKGMFPWVSG
ncbi:MAG: hypothetical protein HYU35_00160 [Parcubacteria group bacterium]|nr:hypothetical protein [Parcubacteria group bacterium]